MIEFGFCDIGNKQGFGKCNKADYTCLDLDYSRYHKNLIQYYYCLEIIPITRNFSAAKTGAGKMKAVFRIEEWY